MMVRKMDRDWIYLGAALCFCAFFTLLWLRFEKKSRNGFRWINAAAVLGWSAAMVYLTILQRQPGYSRVIYWIPFENYVLEDWINSGGFLMNILVFYPLGICLEAAGLGKLGALGIGFGASLAIEVSQYILTRGFCEVNDLIANPLGCLIGALVWYAFKTRNRNA